jgi:hypothetical protein
MRTEFTMGQGTGLRWEPNEPEAVAVVYEELASLTDSLNRQLERKLTSRRRRRSPERGDGHG